MENVKVTVWLSTYNQAPYVAQALDSILMQKTDFPYEIVAADDCSTDGTQEIILEYQKRYPEKIVTYFTPENIGGCKKLTNCIDLGLFRGDYLSYLEGDDYWLGEDRLQTLVDFLDSHREYSRISHRRKVIDENDADRGYDIPASVLNRPFTIEDFLAGKNYSDFGSVFRNYFKQAGGKYHPLLLASRNVCDFQDMFITQDFGPVYVADQVFGVYRSRSVSGATNYNSITTQSARCRENIRLARVVESFYDARYDLSPLVFRNQKRLLAEAVKAKDGKLWEEARAYVPETAVRAIVPELYYLAKRGHREEEVRFLTEILSQTEKRGLYPALARYSIKRFGWKLFGHRPEEQLRGYIRRKKKEKAHESTHD